MDAERRVRETFARVDAWRSAPLFEPLSGTPLALHDADWPHLPLSQSVKLHLDTGAEFLHSVRLDIEAGELLASAHHALLRTAILANALGVWLLAPDEPETRRSRQLSLLDEMYYRHHEYLLGLHDLETASGGEAQANLLQVLPHVAMRHEQVKALRKRAGDTERWNNTRVIRTAASYTFRGQENADDLVAEAVLEWRRGSGAAHALGWNLFNSTAISQDSPTDPQGRAVMGIRGSIDEIANPYMNAYWLAVVGWRLLVLRGR